MHRAKVMIFTEDFLSPSMTFIYRQISTLEKHFEVSVLCRHRSNRKLFPLFNVQEVPVNGVERVTARLRRAMDLGEWKLGKGAAARVKRAIQTVKPDLIHAHFGPSALSILPIARELDIPLIATFHGFDASSYLLRNSYMKSLPDLFKYSKIVCVSEYMRKTLISVGSSAEMTHCHYIGVPISNYTVSDRKSILSKMESGEQIHFLQVSNFVEKKGHIFTVRAFAELVKDYPNCILSFAGAGPTMQEAEQLVDSHQIGDHVRFLGHQDSESVSRLMASSDCFLHHSVTSSNGDKEGIPTVLMEAMASGLPVLSTNHSGIPELISHGINGLLADEKDVKTYTEQLKTVLHDDGQLGKMARKKVEEKFDIEKCSDILVGLYQNLINC